MKFGYLTVESTFAEKDKNGKSRTFAACKCVCGNTIIRQVDNLKTSKFPSCGCMRKKIIQDACRKDLTGKRFGRLVVRKMIWDSRPTKCKCVCDCGTECTVIATQLTYGKTKSCGCLQRERASQSNTKDYTGVTTDSGVTFLHQHKKVRKGVWEWACQCPCGNVFYEIPARVLNGHHTSCGCQLSSSGERIVEGILKDHGIPFSTQYTFNNCKNVFSLRYDFAIIYDDKILFLIEYDGKQHYEPIDWFGGQESFETTKRRDNIKNEYCKKNKIPLLRLPYTLTKEEIESKILKQYKCCESVETAGRSQQYGR